MTSYETSKCEEIISKYKVLAGLNGSKLSLKNILTKAAVETADVFGHDIRNNIPSDISITIWSATLGSGANRLLTGWIPIAGKVVNHYSAALMVEEVVHETAKYFD